MGRAKNNMNATDASSRGASASRNDAFAPVLGADRGLSAVAATAADPDPRDAVMPPAPADKVNLAPDAVENLLAYLHDEFGFTQEDNHTTIAESLGDAASKITHAAAAVGAFSGQVRPVMYPLDSYEDDSVVLAVEIKDANFRLMGPYSLEGKQVLSYRQTGATLIEGFLASLTDMSNQIIDDFKKESGGQLPVGSQP